MGTTRMRVGLHCWMLFLSSLLLVSSSWAGKNDVPTGAGEAEISEPNKPVWWQGALQSEGDVDWYWFDVGKKMMLLLAFEKPANRVFFCRLYSEDNTKDVLVDVIAGNAGEEFAGYTSIKLNPGKYYLKIWGEGDDPFQNEEEKVYKYALSEAPPSKKGSSDQEDEQQEMKPEDVERLLDSLQAEEEDQREIKMREEKREMPEVLKDW